MREILFRGKRLDIANAGWAYGNLIKSEFDRATTYSIQEQELSVACPNEPKSIFMRYLVDPQTVGQFTGLYDRDGKKVFEGDIIRYQSSDGEWYLNDTGAIRYGMWNCDCCDGIYGWGSENADIRKLEDEPSVKGSGYVVIGNIHDHPELLEVKQWENSEEAE